MGVLLLAVICALAPAGARADEGEPDWVFHVSQPTMSHFCDQNSLYPEDVDAPWDQVAYGIFEFDFWRQVGFLSEEPLACLLSYGGLQFPINTSPSYSCSDWPECYTHGIDVIHSFKVLNPTSAHDFAISVTTAYCNLTCGTIDCSHWGNLTGTLYLYAYPTAITPNSFSTIKAMY